MQDRFAIVAIIFALGGLGSLVSAFVGDSSWHLPEFDWANGVYRPGWIGNALVGGLAAVGSWASANAGDWSDPNATAFHFTNAALASALAVGFGGASWFKSQSEKSLLRGAAVVAAGKNADPAAAAAIATSAPSNAFKAAVAMR